MSPPRRVALLLALLALAPAAKAAEEPLAWFKATPQEVGTGAVVRVDAAGSRPSDAARNITEYAWRWTAGDEYEPGNATANHSYNASGVHVVGLRVTDDAGRVAFANQSVLVKGALPEGNFFFELQEESGGTLRVRVNATFSLHSAGAREIVRYEWDWGETKEPAFVVGNVTEEHVYERPGAYTITLRVTDDEGRSNAYRNPVVVKSTFWTRMALVWDERDRFLEGARMTLLLAVGATILGFALAVVLALLRIARNPLLRWPAAVYVEVIRGTPLLVQILIAWLVLPSMGVRLPILYAGALALVVNTSAYQAEAIRGGIQAIPSGQMEAATSLGMTYLQAMRHVVLPQAFRLTLPPLGNEFIILLKDTSLVSVIGVTELTQVARIFSGTTFLVLETWLGVAAIYFVMTYSLSILLRRAERRFAIPGMGLGGAA